VDELFASGIKLAYPPEYSFIVENGDETEVSNVQRNGVNCSSRDACIRWAIHHKSASVLFNDLLAGLMYAAGVTSGENSEPLLCKLQDGVVYNNCLRMVMLQGDPLKRRVTEIIDRVVEAGLYNYWVSQKVYSANFFPKKASVHPRGGYYSFNLYHMQPAFYLLSMGWCLSALCFIFELLYNCILCKRK
jgi:hypothetical protein